jgi:hypothetical protein
MLLDAPEPKVASDPNETREQYVARIEAEGFKAVYPADNELFVDIDTDAQHEAFGRSWAILSRDIPEATVSEHPSKSGLPCRHITVKLPFTVTPWERIAFQGALGSDPVRELLSAMRLRNGSEPATLFCEKRTTDDEEILF